MGLFFSVDWGTSSLRIRLIQIQHSVPSILYEHSDYHGIAHVFTVWEQENAGKSRESFFLGFLKPWLQQAYAHNPAEAEQAPVIISGMASSSIGIRELPYSSLPFNVDGDSLRYEVISRTPGFSHDVLLLSGICSDNDIMRGEEVQLMGLRDYESFSPEALYIFPGTHSKHILVRDNEVISFKTYITGELFKLLAENSLLKNSITKAAALHEYSFQQGLTLSAENILSSVFRIRANTVLNNHDVPCHYSFLSGLLIGNELSDLKQTDTPVYLCAHNNVSNSYALALRQLSLKQRITIVPPGTVDKSVIQGQQLMFQKVFREI